ncbi:MAG: hypothetical protein IK069_03695 [Firmicutes bacterium]|nr:hypothetical protein [Bacillota bacterium]
MARIRCPNLSCRSTACVPVAQNKKYKPVKGLIGGAIGGYFLGPIGALAGAGTGFNGKGKVKFVCQNCGKVFVQKL